MSLLSLIYKKREGQSITADEIQGWIDSMSGPKGKRPPEYQIASLLAFIFTKGMTPDEITALTNAMRFSGQQFKYKGFPKDAFFADKHSTGGVGDKITLPLVPLVIASSEKIYIPTITGRALGHTGGTVDKLESIPGCKVGLPIAKFYKLLKKNRACFLGQTEAIAPADRIIYALRDATGTVESIPLITASILSKKLSESLNYLLLDVKTGNGAFLRDPAQSEALAKSLLSVCQLAGVKAQVSLTRMDTPLGHYSGNRLEILETLQILNGEGPPSSTALTLDFAIKILEASGESMGSALRKTKEALETGKAFEVFKKMIESQGGSLARLERVLNGTTLKLKTKSILAPKAGTLHFDVRELGLALVELGAGRKRKEDKVDPDVGCYHTLETGDRVESGQEVLKIYYRDAAKLKACEAHLKRTNAIRIDDVFVKKAPLIRNF